MTTATSFSSLGRFLAMYRQDLRRVRGTTLFYWVLTFLFFPLQYFMEILSARGYNDYGSYDYYNLYGPGEIYNVASYLLFFPLMVLFTILIAVQLMGYMQNKRAVDVYHALPVTRVQTMGAHFAAGMTAVGLPLILNFLVVMLIKALAGPAYGMGEVMMECLFWLCTVFVLFGITAFAAVNVGTNFDTVIFSLFLNGILPLSYLLCVGIFSGYLYGYIADINPLLKMSPFILLVLHQMVQWSGNGIYTQVTNICNEWFLIWFGIGLAIMALTIFLYARRKSENAESLGTSGPLKLVVKFTGTFVGALLFGLLFQGIFGGYSWMESGLYANRYFIIGTVIGAFITYMVIEVVLARGFKTMKRNIPLLIGSMGAMAAFTVIVCTGGLGYATRIPALADVRAVTLNYQGLGGISSHYTLLENPNNFYSAIGPSTVTLTSDEAKEIVLRLHQSLIDDWKAEADASSSTAATYTNGYYEEIEYYDEYYGEEPYPVVSNNYSFYWDLNLDYNLGGLHHKRNYTQMNEETSKILLELESCDEFIEKTNPILVTNPLDIRSLSFYNTFGQNESALPMTDENTRRLLEAARSDLFAQTREELSGGRPVGYITFGTKNIPYVETDPANPLESDRVRLSGTTLPVYPSNTAMMALLQEFGLEEKQKIDLSGFTNAHLDVFYPDSYYGKGSILNPSLVLKRQGDFYGTGSSYYGNHVYITADKAEMQMLLDMSQNRFFTDKPMMVLSFYQLENQLTLEEQYEYYGLDPALPENRELLQQYIDADSGEESPACFYIPFENLPDDILLSFISVYEEDYYNTDTLNMLRSIYQSRHAGTATPGAAN